MTSPPPRAIIAPMNKDPVPKTFLHKVGGYYLIPHELLHVLAYRLIGQPCRYNVGDYAVRALAPETITRREQVFVLLLPFTVFFGLGLLCHLLWILSAFFITIPPDRYFIDGPTWHFIFPNLGVLLMLYSGTARKDLLIVYHLLFRKDKPQDNRPDPHRDPQSQGDQRHQP